MKWIRVPALAGCFAVALGGSAMWAQTDTTSGSGQTGAGQTTGAGQSGAGQTTGASQTGGAASKSDAQSQGNSMAKESGSDKKFVKEAMEGSMAEIKLGQMAQQKASSPDVKQFGQKMVDDHTKLSDQMSPIASQMGVTPPTDLSAKDKALQKKLDGMSGPEFDKAYMKAMVKDHQKDLSEFQKEASSGKNPQVKDAAQQGSQVIQQHLQMAQQIAQKVGGGSGSMSGGAMNGSGMNGSGNGDTSGSSAGSSGSGSSSPGTSGSSTTTSPQQSKPQQTQPQQPSQPQTTSPQQ